eukprot:1160691-Pelagomonas_calceolata.AAC.2
MECYNFAHALHLILPFSIFVAPSHEDAPQRKGGSCCVCNIQPNTAPTTLCYASRSSLPMCLPMSMLTKPASQRLLLRAVVIILPATLWRPVFMLDLIWVQQPESMCSAMSNR